MAGDVAELRSVGMLRGASDVKALTISGCTTVHPYVRIVIASFATAPATFRSRKSYEAGVLHPDYPGAGCPRSMIYDYHKANRPGSDDPGRYYDFGKESINRCPAQPWRWQLS